MADSLKFVDDDFTPRIHSGVHPGHLHKGHGTVGAASSIPTKYKTIVTDGSDKKGFDAQAKRFNYERGMNECPGPGTYIAHGKVDNNSTSFSKRGTGGMASKTKRTVNFESFADSPGPGKYAINNRMNDRNDFNKASVSRTFQKPIATQTNKIPLPAPNQYKIVVWDLSKKPGACSSFKSGSQLRSSLNVGDAKNMPSPCQYEVNDDACHYGSKFSKSMFQSKTIRGFYGDLGDIPAPNHYKPHEPVEYPKKQVFPRRHYLCLSAPAMPMPPPLVDPGPGAYDIVNYEGPSKHFMSGSAFVSATSRWTGDLRDPAIPGPAHYRPTNKTNQSFIYNHAGRWL